MGRIYGSRGNFRSPSTRSGCGSQLNSTQFAGIQSDSTGFQPAVDQVDGKHSPDPNSLQHLLLDVTSGVKNFSFGAFKALASLSAVP
jgi:hypothetical protein